MRVSSYSFLDTMNDFVLFMAIFSKEHNTKYRYAYDRSGVSQMDCEYINVPLLVRRVENFVTLLNTLGDSPFHSGIRRNKTLVPGSTAKMEDWSFGCANECFDQGFYLCSAICYTSILELRSFSAIVDSKRYYFDCSQSITCDYLATFANQGDRKLNLEWYCECAYVPNGAWIQFYGRRCSLSVCLNYDPVIENNISDIMSAVWDVLKDEHIHGISV